TWTVPWFAVSRPLRQRRSVVLPEPDEPMSATTCPSWTVRSTERSTSCVPNDLRRPRTASSAGASVPASARDIPVEPPLDPALTGGQREADDPVDRCRLQVDQQELPAERRDLLGPAEHLGDQDDRGQRRVLHQGDER